MKQLVVFDLDGTLVNSIYDLADCVNAALDRNSLPQNKLEDYYMFVGNGMEHLVRTSMREKGSDNDLYTKVRMDFDALYEKHCNDKTCAYEGVTQLLMKLTAEGVKTAVLSNKAQRFISPILQKNFPEHTFSLAWGQREGVPRKPNPHGLELLIEETGFDKSQCVYIGDSSVDILTAQNAGVGAVGVLWGFRSEQELIDAGAQRLAATPEELYRHIVSM